MIPTRHRFTMPKSGQQDRHVRAQLLAVTQSTEAIERKICDSCTTLLVVVSTVWEWSH
jgi:hypothetical protein